MPAAIMPEIKLQCQKWANTVPRIACQLTFSLHTKWLIGKRITGVNAMSMECTKSHTL